MSADPLELLFAQLNKELHDKMGMCFSDRYAVQEILKPMLKSYGEQCVMDYRSEKASDAISAAMHCWNPSNDHIKKKEGDPS